MRLISANACNASSTPNLHSRAGCVTTSWTSSKLVLLPTCTLARDASMTMACGYRCTRPPNLHSRAGCVDVRQVARGKGELPTCTLARDASANITKMQAVCMEYIYIIYTLPSALTSYGAKRASESVTLLDFWVWSHPCRRCEGRANTLFTSPSHVAFH